MVKSDAMSMAAAIASFIITRVPFAVAGEQLYRRETKGSVGESAFTRIKLAELRQCISGLEMTSKPRRLVTCGVLSALVSIPLAHVRAKVCATLAL
jgi:hypothetical protein